MVSVLPLRTPVETSQCRQLFSPKSPEVAAVAKLLENAIAYSPDGKGITVSVKPNEDGTKVLLSVLDRGCGIAQKEQSRIFERFYRVDKARSRKAGGTGLGLAIVKHIALLHHARIDLQSQVGSGTTIKVTFPKA